MNATTPVAEKNQSLWLLVVSPTIWSIHFLGSYITAAIWCEKMASPDNSLGAARTAIWAFTGWSGYKRHAYGDGMLPHDEDTPEDRHRFLGFATLLLSVLSLVAVLFEAIVLAYFWTCD